MSEDLFVILSIVKCSDMSGKMDIEAQLNLYPFPNRTFHKILSHKINASGLCEIR